MCKESIDQRDFGGLIRNYGKGTLLIKKPGKPVTNIKNWVLGFTEIGAFIPIRVSFGSSG